MVNAKGLGGLVRELAWAQTGEIMAVRVMCAMELVGTDVGPTNPVGIVEVISSIELTGQTFQIIVNPVDKISTKTARILIATAKSSTKSIGTIFPNTAPVVVGTTFNVPTLIAMARVALMLIGPIRPSTVVAKVGTKKHAKTHFAISRLMSAATGPIRPNIANAMGGIS